MIFPVARLLAQQDLRPALSTKGAKQKRRQVSRGPDPAKKNAHKKFGKVCECGKEFRTSDNAYYKHWDESHSRTTKFFFFLSEY